MGLTLGSAPFGPGPAGVFNFDHVGPDKVLYWEDFPKRFRVVIGGEVVADSRRVKALHETGQVMRLCVPRDDVRMELLVDAGSTRGSAATGGIKRWTSHADRTRGKPVARSYEASSGSFPPIVGYVSFELGAVDAWYLEDDLGYAHPRDPYHRFDVHNAARRVVVRARDVILAESNRPRVLFETGLPPRYYLPQEDVRTALLEKSQTVSQCPYKGDGQHWHVRVDNAPILDAAWSLPAPLGEAVQIRGWICFYPEKVTIEVDGQSLAV